GHGPLHDGGRGGAGHGTSPGGMAHRPLWLALDFFINVPVGLVGIGMAATVLADPPHVRRTLARIDLVGIALLTLSLTTMQLVLERGEREGWWESSFIVVTACVALVTLMALVYWELRVAEPVVNLRVLTHLPLLGGVSMGLVFGLTSFGSI